MMNIVVSSGVNGLDANYAIVTLRIASIAVLLTAFSPFIDRGHVFLIIGKKAIVLLCAGGLIANGLDGSL
jgi:hypothetical protein